MTPPSGRHAVTARAGSTMGGATMGGSERGQDGVIGMWASYRYPGEGSDLPPEPLIGDTGVGDRRVDDELPVGLLGT
jgi:hypothetical protein